MLEKIRQWFTAPPENPGDYTDADERILEQDNARYAANLELDERIRQMPRRRFSFSFWFFFF